MEHNSQQILLTIYMKYSLRRATVGFLQSRSVPVFLLLIISRLDYLSLYICNIYMLYMLYIYIRSKS